MADETTVSQYLTFSLDKEQFAVDISKVREVLEFSSVTKVPRTPDFMRGVINLRGSVVPVIDLRLKLGLSRTEATIDTCVIIIEVDAQGEHLVLGALADSVQEVIDLDQKNIEPPPRIGTRVSIDFIRGIGKRDESFVMLLDINRVLTDEEIRAVGEGASAAEGAPVGEGSGSSPGEGAPHPSAPPPPEPMVEAR
jgi:purine-binding chemotaxis protein CheW